jgi:hypothetical protein
MKTKGRKIGLFRFEKMLMKTNEFHLLEEMWIKIKVIAIR